MPNPIYLSPKANPWEAMLPQLLGNLFLAKVKHGWDMETAAEEAKRSTAQFLEKEDYKQQKEIKTAEAKAVGERTRNYETLAQGRVVSTLEGQDPADIGMYDIRQYGGKYYLLDKPPEGYVRDPVDLKLHKAEDIPKAGIVTLGDGTYELRHDKNGRAFLGAKLGAEGGGYKPKTEAEAIRLREAGRIVINVGDKAVEKAEAELYRVPGYMLETAKKNLNLKLGKDVKLKSQITKTRVGEGSYAHEVVKEMSPYIRTRHPQAVLKQRKNGTWAWIEDNKDGTVKIIADSEMGYYTGE